MKIDIRLESIEGKYGMLTVDDLRDFVKHLKPFDGSTPIRIVENQITVAHVPDTSLRFPAPRDSLGRFKKRT